MFEQPTRYTWYCLISMRGDLAEVDAQEQIVARSLFRSNQRGIKGSDPAVQHSYISVYCIKAGVLLLRVWFPMYLGAHALQCCSIAVIIVCRDAQRAVWTCRVQRGAVAALASLEDAGIHAGNLTRHQLVYKVDERLDTHSIAIYI